MPTIEHSVVIDRPVADVFAFLADFENRSKFESDVVEAERTTDGDIGVGATFREVRKVMGWRTVTVHEIRRISALRADHVRE